MVTRKKTILSTPFVEITTPVAPAPEAFSFKAHMHKLLDEALDAESPSWKRLLLAWTLGLATSFGVGYLGTALMTYALVGAALLTSSAFVAILIAIIGVLASMYLGYRASMFVYVKVMDKSIDRAWNKVTGMFGFATKKVAS